MTKLSGFFLTITLVAFATFVQADIPTQKRVRPLFLDKASYTSSYAVALNDVETSTEDGGDTYVKRTYDRDTGKLLEVVRQTEIWDPNDKTAIHKRVTTKNYDQGKRPPYETSVEKQEIVLVEKPRRHRVVRTQTKTKTIYTKTKSRDLVMEVTEEKELVAFDAKGEPIYKGTRVTSFGKGAVSERNEVWDAKTGEWVPAKFARARQAGTFRLSPSDIPIYGGDNEKHYAVDDELNRTKIEKKTEVAKADSRDAKIDGASSADGTHALLDYCAISANPKFQKVCYSLWRQVCSSIPDRQKQRRCNNVLQPGGPRLADGGIWDFCASVDRPFRQWCYDDFRHVVIGACRNTTRLTTAVGKACRERAANLPSNLPAQAQPATKTTKRECKKGGGLVGAMDCITTRMGDEPAKPTPKSAKERPAPPSAGSTDKKTGISTTSVKNPDGTRTVTRTDKDGNVLSKETVGKAPVSASATDTKTGITTTSVKNPDGTRTVTKTDKNGNILSRESVR